VQEIIGAVTWGNPDDLAATTVPKSYFGVVVRKDEQGMFEGVATPDKDPRKSLHVNEVATPELGPSEAIVAVMASSVNFNTVWTSIFEPVSTFGFLERYGRLSELTKRHDLPYHVVGSDLSGVVLAVGPGVRKWKAGTRSSRTACRSSSRTPRATRTR
jgi:crotonyl-CoA reductase